MSTYILTSMFPNGFDTQTAEVFRNLINRRKKFAFVASEFEKIHEKTDKYLNFFLDMFEKAGIQFEDKYVIDARMNASDAQKSVAEADVVWLAGGDTPTQFRYLQEYGLVSVIKRHDGVIIGMSAGSINMAKTAICTLSCGHEKQQIYNGIGCVDISVEPHFDITSVSKELLDLSESHTICGLCDDSFIVCTDNSVEYYGEIYNIENRRTEKL